MKNNIEIILPCGHNSDYYCDFFIKNVLMTVSDSSNVTFSLGINNFDQFDKSIIEKYQDYAKFRLQHINTETEAGSIGHAVVLNKLLADCDSEYCLVADCDTAFLASCWDVKLLSKLSNDVAIVGTEYYKNSNLAKYLNFPNAMMCLFKTDLMKSIKLDFSPGPGPHIICNKQEEIWWGRPIGIKIYLDTGYSLPVTIKNANYTGYVLTYNPTSMLGIGTDYNLDGDLFFSHLKGASTTTKSDQRSIHWMNYVEKYCVKRNCYMRKLS